MTIPTDGRIDLDVKALEAAENAYAAATMDLPHHDCEDCGGSGVVITGRGETAGGDTCATCGGGGVVVDFPEGWDPMASAIIAYLAALPPSPAVVPSGWVMVPVVATAAMLDAHYEAHARADTAFAGAQEVWAAMLAAAPPSPPALDGAGRDAVIEKCAKAVRVASEQPIYSGEMRFVAGHRLGVDRSLAAIRALKETP